MIQDRYRIVNPIYVGSDPFEWLQSGSTLNVASFEAPTTPMEVIRAFIMAKMQNEDLKLKRSQLRLSLDLDWILKFSRDMKEIRLIFRGVNGNIREVYTFGWKLDKEWFFIFNLTDIRKLPTEITSSLLLAFKDLAHPIPYVRATSVPNHFATDIARANRGFFKLIFNYRSSSPFYLRLYANAVLAFYSFSLSNGADCADEAKALKSLQRCLAHTPINK